MPVAPPTRCGAMGCHAFATNRGRCDDHQPQPWANRARKQDRYGISSGTWRSLKRQVDRRDHHTCYVCGREAEDDEPLDLEHKTPISEGGSPRDLDNLGMICGPCHEIKSKAEAARANRERTLRRNLNLEDL